MKYITTETAADIARAMTMAVVHTWFDFRPNDEHVDRDKVRETVVEAFEKWAQAEGIEVIDTDEPDYPEIHVFFDDTEIKDDDCDYEIGYDPFSGSYTDDV